MRKLRLMTPGPTMIPPEVTAEMVGPMDHHRTAGHRQILKEITENQEHLIVFIDEVHTIVGAGALGGEGGLDVANVFKPALARGELHLIGATTLNEYQKHIEKDAALELRFQTVFVAEPTIAQTIMILRGLRDTLEAHHKVTITDAAIVAAAELSDRYITGRFLPDKAIDLVDQAAARVKMSATARPVDVQELEAEARQLKREQDYAASRKRFDRAKELQRQYEAKNKEVEGMTERWRRDRASASAASPSSRARSRRMSQETRRSRSGPVRSSSGTTRSSKQDATLPRPPRGSPSTTAVRFPAGLSRLPHSLPR